MEKKLEEYIPFYLGCDCYCFYDGEKEFEGILHGVRKDDLEDRVNPVSVLGVTLGLRAKRISFYKYDEVKLLLRPLLDMTDEDVNMLWSDMGLNPNFGEYLHDNRLEYIQNKLSANCQYPYNFTITIELANWLRSKSFDVDGLIECGLALDKTKIL